MKAWRNKIAEEALGSELKAMEAMEGEFGESESNAFEKCLIPDDELELVAGGDLPVFTTASPRWFNGLPSNNSGPLIR